MPKIIKKNKTRCGKKNKTRCGKRNKNKTRCGKRHLKKRGGAPGDGDLERLRKAYDDVARQRNMEDPYLQAPLSSKIIEEDNEKIRKLIESGVLPQTLSAFLPTSVPMAINDKGEIAPYVYFPEPSPSQMSDEVEVQEPFPVPETLPDSPLLSQMSDKPFPESFPNFPPPSQKSDEALMNVFLDRETKRRRKRGGGTYTQVKRNKKKFNGTKRHYKKRGGGGTSPTQSKELKLDQLPIEELERRVIDQFFSKEPPHPAEAEAFMKRYFKQINNSPLQVSEPASEEDIKELIASLEHNELLEFAKLLIPDINTP